MGSTASDYCTWPEASCVCVVSLDPWKILESKQNPFFVLISCSIIDILHAPGIVHKLSTRVLSEQPVCNYVLSTSRSAVSRSPVLHYSQSARYK